MIESDMETIKKYITNHKKPLLIAIVACATLAVLVLSGYIYRLNHTISIMQDRIVANEQVIMALVKGELPRVKGASDKETIPTLKILGEALNRINKLEQSIQNGDTSGRDQN